MPSISLTDLVDVVSKSGLPKSTKVREIKNRPAYHPATDFYKRFREGVVSVHENGGGKPDIRKLLLQTDAKKHANYADLVSGYNRWWGRKGLSWFEPAADTWSAHGIDVRINPELGLIVDGRPHVIKLYMKDEKLSKLRVDIITHLLRLTLGSRVQSGTVLSVLDVRNAKLFVPGPPAPALTATLQAELAYVASLWPHV